MNAIADFGTGYLQAGPLEHAVRYLSWENLKGGLISISIGFALYFGFVRPVLMRKENGARVYVDRWPKRLDLEELVYRPLLLKWLPGLLGPIVALFGENRVTAPAAKRSFRVAKTLSHAVSDLVDAFVLLLRKTVCRDNPPPADDKARTSPSYRLGRQLDRIAIRRGREEQDDRRYAIAAYRSVRTIRSTFHRNTDNLSFALLMLVLAISAIFVYILVLR
jgi:hypothetical protein